MKYNPFSKFGLPQNILVECAHCGSNKSQPTFQKSILYNIFLQTVQTFPKEQLIKKLDDSL